MRVVWIIDKNHSDRPISKIIRNEHSLIDWLLIRNVPSANQCLDCLSTDKLFSVVNIIISASWWSTKASPRSVVFKCSCRTPSEPTIVVARCRRIVCKMISVRGIAPAALSGKVQRAEWRIVLDGSSDIAARVFIWLLSSMAEIRSGFGACVCVVVWDKKASIDKFVWQRAESDRERSAWQIRYTLYRRTFKISILTSKDHLSCCCFLDGVDKTNMCQ